MTDVFAAFGISRLSPSQLRSWSEDRGQWYARQIARVFDDAGPAAWRGDAVEAGLQFALEGRAGDPMERARGAFDARSMDWARAHDGEIHQDYEENWTAVERCLPRAIAAWKAENLPSPTAYQQQVETYIPGAPTVAIVGRADCCLGPKGKGWTLDLKTANRIPSTPKDENKKPEASIDHAIQAACYAIGRGEDKASLLYVSAAERPSKPHILITLGREEIGFYARAAGEIIRQIEATLRAALCVSDCEPVSPQQALAELCRPNMLAQGGGTYSIWKPEYAQRAIAAVPAWNRSAQ